jgi:peptidoglycan/LPS O-acetylase OafA/YrhL
VVSYRFAHDATDAVALGKSLVTFGVNAGLLEGWFQFARGGWNPPGWSLCVEAFFYALFPFIAPLLWRSRHRDGTLLLLVFALASIAPALSHTGWIPSHERFSLEIVPVVRLPEFLFGIVLARAFRRTRSPSSSWPLWVAGTLVLCAAVWQREQIPSVMLQTGILMPAFGLIIFGLGRGAGFAQRLLSHPTLVLLGDASYGIYILHVPLAWWCQYLLQDGLRLSQVQPPFAADRPVYYAIYLAVLVGLSIASLRWFEDPARRWIRQLAARNRRRAEAAPARELVQEAR